MEFTAWKVSQVGSAVYVGSKRRDIENRNKIEWKSCCFLWSNFRYWESCEEDPCILNHREQTVIKSHNEFSKKLQDIIKLDEEKQSNKYDCG